MIRRIELHNLATHENTEIELDKGKNIIIGATGSGKTNLLLAIDFAFTGEVPGVNLSELIADDAGGVIGVKAEGAAGNLQIKVRKGVVLATGGFGRDMKRLEAIDPRFVQMIPVVGPGHSIWRLRTATAY